MCITAGAEQQKKAELLRLRHEAQHDRKAHAMASRTKDNLLVYNGNEGKTAELDKTEEEPVVDLKHLFTKHDRRVPHLPSDKIPDVLSQMKERHRKRQLEREEAKKAAEAEAEAEKLAQQKLDREAFESDLKSKKLSASSHSSSDRNRHSPLNSVPSKLVSTDKHLESKVKKKSHRPPMSFEQLMALAQQKQAQPVIDKQPSSVPKKTCTDQGRPMTQEEKERQKRRETKEYQDWLKYGGSAPSCPSSGKSRHQHHSRDSYSSQRMTVPSNLSENAFEESESEESDSDSDEITNIQPQETTTRMSHSHNTVSRLKDGTDMPYKQSSVTKYHSEKPFSSHSGSSHQSVKRLKPNSSGEVLFTKGKVMSSAKDSKAGQNGKSNSLSDELIEKLKEERRKMADRGDAVPSLADMLQELLNKCRGEANSLESTQKHHASSRTESVRPSSSSSKSKMSISEQKAEKVRSSGSRSGSSLGSGNQPSSRYVSVNETVVDCTRDKSDFTKHMKSGDKRPTKCTWEDMRQRAMSKNPNHIEGI